MADFNISVLFVEDNDTLRFLYEKMISRRVNKVFSGENGQVGLDLFLQHKPDLVLTDISMPVMDGLQMIKKIKEHAPDVKVIVMSAYSNNEYFLEAISLGVNGYLIKPVDASRLFAVIQDMATTIIIKKELEKKELERRQAEEDLKRSLAEKDILLREVHHRVKNNMQIISSILHMQERLVVDPGLISILHESQNRIRSMALIHEHLYQSQNLANIRFDNYVKNLAVNLSRTYSDLQRKIKFNYDIAEVHFPLDIGIPCGLILNELISNSFKHAFKDKTTGTINIVLKKEMQGGYLLEISDDGIGMKSPVDPEKSGSLGMKIVHNLVRQLEGSISYDFSSGTKFLIKFNV
ncbi:MAG TPA: response regulator [Bacteroidales bacterium]|nr:response regulator [Bacteroidales bacterium]HRW96335.1 response regulator [Bacteroidales bacterium]